MIEHVEPNKTVGGEWRLRSARFPTVSAVSKVAMDLKIIKIKLYSVLFTVSSLLTIIFHPFNLKQHPKNQNKIVF